MLGKVILFLCFGWWCRVLLNVINWIQHRTRKLNRGFDHKAFAHVSSPAESGRLLRMSATQLAAAIRSGEVLSETVVRAHIARVCQTHPALNAMVRERFATALQEAREADARVVAWRQRGCRASEALPALLGVPCTVKECIALEGMPQSSGLVQRAGWVVGSDENNATVVQRTLRLGAIPLGSSNLSELCMWYESSNAVYGRTNNAYSQGHTCGGSSGGEGALVGAGCSPFGIGSDIGGSIRMPAVFNGVFGHKASGGLVPATGQYPIAHGTCKRMLCTGPLCRSSEDLWPLLSAMAGPDGIDDSVLPLSLGDPSAVWLPDLTIYSPAPPRGLLLTDCSREMLAARRRALEFLQSKGARVVELAIPELQQGFDFWSSRMSTNPSATPFDVLLGSPDGDRARLHCGLELLKWCFGASPHTLPALGLGLLEHVTVNLPEPTHRRNLEGCEALRVHLNAMLAGHAVILFPGFPTTAPRHNEPILRIFDVLYTAVWNALELPVTTAPLGLSPAGLPLGIQIVGAHGQDHLTIAVACALEQGKVAGWIPPPNFPFVD